MHPFSVLTFLLLTILPFSFAQPPHPEPFSSPSPKSSSSSPNSSPGIPREALRVAANHFGKLFVTNQKEVMKWRHIEHFADGPDLPPSLREQYKRLKPDEKLQAQARWKKAREVATEARKMNRVHAMLLGERPVKPWVPGPDDPRQVVFSIRGGSSASDSGGTEGSGATSVHEWQERFWRDFKTHDEPPSRGSMREGAERERTQKQESGKQDGSKQSSSRQSSPRQGSPGLGSPRRDLLCFGLGCIGLGRSKGKKQRLRRQ